MIGEGFEVIGEFEAQFLDKDILEDDVTTIINEAENKDDLIKELRIYFEIPNKDKP